MTKTPNVALNLIPFDQIPWDVDANENTSILDGILGQYFAITQFKGLWKNSTTYVVGDNVIDAASGAQYVCSVGNTSSASPVLFSAERVAHGTYWTQAAASAASYATAAAASAVAAAAAVGGSGFLHGLGMSWVSIIRITVGAGSCVDSTGTSIITLPTMDKTTAVGAWVAGSGNAGMGVSLTAAASTWYHVFAIMVGGVGDVYFDTSPSGANKPVGTTAFRRIGSVKTDGIATIIPFDQYGDRFDWRTPVNELTTTPGVTTAVTQTLVAVPIGVVVEAMITGVISDPTAANAQLYLSSLAQADIAAGTGSTGITGPIGTGAASYRASVMTNTLAQIRRRVSTTTLLMNFTYVNGWIDRRGK